MGTALGNGFPGGGRGIQIAGGPQGNRIGTDGLGVADAAERNVISGNRGAGIFMGNPGTDNNTFAGNYIGTDATGTAPLGNENSGIVITDGGKGNRILGNTIAFNASRVVSAGGVRIAFSGTTGNRIQGNSIYSNSGLGIDLTTTGAADGVTANDDGDPDTGPNNFQNFPVLSVAHSGPKTFVAGTLNSLANTVLTLDFYASPAADPAGYGEGARYLGSWTGSTVGNDLSFAVLLAAATSAGEVITATATEEPTGNTSEFSAAVTTTDLVVIGTTGNDAYVFSAHSSGGVEVFLNGLSQGVAVQVVVTDPDGSDTYTVNFGGWTGNVTLNDTGTTGTDALTFNGTAADDSFNKPIGFVQWKLTADLAYQTRVDFTGFGDTGDSITLVAGAGNDTIHDPGTNTAILGGPGDDTIIIDASFGNGVVADGGDGSDTYVVAFGSLTAPVTIADSGTTGSDTLAVQGTPGPDAFLLAGNQVQNGAESVIIASPITNLTVAGGGGVDSTTIDGFTAPTTNLAVDGTGGTNAVTIVGSPPPGVTLDLIGAVQTVDINIKPNEINLANRGVIPVVLYTTASFNAALVDVSSVVFAGAHAFHSSLRDVDHDGDLDLVLDFRTQDTNLRQLYGQLLAEDDQVLNGRLDCNVDKHQLATLALTGTTVDGLQFQGFDAVDLFLSGKALRAMLAELAAAGLI
ncbi:MAG: right-handed parallel beta-helix repeat-containing protein [Planctomycetes bacterium]|nr:right-handed parallel beta-helix repeat-containing protein [Planctomycetota bacterium]